MHDAAAKQMDMQMIHCLPSVWTAVHYHAKSTLQLMGCGEFDRHSKQMAHKRLVGHSDFRK